ncbi:MULTISPECIES: class 1 isoprenoid biosynthesis enzyme [unclassified Clostridium]|uniref:class 1 isoprenoid biosynthesis enzyme n=1 Tax=unclassified Clostridium TaxID=2614128 RepID=UPI0025BF7433|nr:MULTISPECIES: class 1 isoprenoid biosynthesis enzyme [unclassified Clostridium]
MRENTNLMTKDTLGLNDLYKNVWWNTNKDFPKLDGEVSYFEKIKMEKQTDKFINEIIKIIESFPNEDTRKNQWRDRFNNIIDEFINKSPLINSKDKEILLSRELLKSTEEFINVAKTFDSNISTEDIGQAMRNVWIMNILQMLFGMKVAFTDSIFGYSMLYPYTDNYLDNPKISKEEKVNTNVRLEKRLKGELIEPNNEYEKRVFDLVSKIENTFAREIYPEVFQSLIYIYNGQVKSMIQQGKRTSPYETDILGISIEKGGSSVLADGYLVKGKLSYEEARFCYGYGILLQICDDLQDATEDLENNHMTIISQLAEKWDLDNITNGLINFTINLIEDVECFQCRNIKELKQLIKKNCLQLIYFAIAANKNLYSKSYFKEIEKYFPYRRRYMIKLFDKLKKKFSNMKESYNGVSIEEIIKYGLLGEEVNFDLIYDN